MLLLLALALTGAPPAASNTHFSHTLRTTAPPARIWAIWTDVPAWPTWDSPVRQATLNGPFAVGSRGRLVPRKGFKATFEVVAVEPGQSYTLRTKLPLGALFVKRTLRLEGGQTVFTHEVWFAGLSKRFFGRALGQDFRAVLPEVMAAIKQQAEQ